MSRSTVDVMVCGAGIVGVAVAHRLVLEGVRSVALCDPRPPLSLTSDKSTECYRNFWPSASMVALMNRSIDLMEEASRESGDTVGLNRRGYLYVTANPARLDALSRAATVASEAGSGPVRVHSGASGGPGYRPSHPHDWRDAPDGLDVFTDGDTLRSEFPALGETVVGGLHVRRAGWVSAQQLGAHMLAQALDGGATLTPAEIVGVDTKGGRVRSVTLSDGSTVSCRAFVNAAGPMLARVSALMGEAMPVHSEVHLKVSARDVAGAMPRDAPLMIWADDQRLDWSDEERGHLQHQGRDDLLGDLPEGCHGRPEGGADSPWMLALWEYEKLVREPTWPIPQDPLYPEVVLRGMTAMLPAMRAYRDRLPQTVVDGGYYTKTAENRPLAGPTGIEGSFVAGAVSGFGVMAACGVADLVAAHVTGRALPPHAAGFSLERYDDAAYRAEIDAERDSGQI